MCPIKREPVHPIKRERVQLRRVDRRVRALRHVVTPTIAVVPPVSLPPPVVVKAPPASRPQLVSQINPDIDKFTFTKPRDVASLSIVVPIRYTPDRLYAIPICANYLKLQNPAQIVIVEEGLSPKFREMAIDAGATYMFLKSVRPFNKSRCINCGVALSNNECVMMHDADMILQNGFVPAAMDVLGQYDAGHLVRDIIFLDHLPTLTRINFSHTKRWASSTSWGCFGGNILFRRQIFIDIGGMDEEFEGSGSEDAEFYHRVKLATRFSDNRNMIMLHMPHSRNSETHDRNWDLWQKAKSASPIVRIKHLKDRLNNNWGLR